ncbi:WSC-domain protein [Pyrenophora tritici-repentis]|nr:WSC-domain protein [Pyrenophora tritici-repentis]KAI0584386.1 WSC-domain protein [Pyrenophora tritici-repentis]KAI0610533.1 WSC-domain protein [Pyrenophora tritici-repentis]KAI0622594.1 WSC-domain protein [Pyrenophora tritici-repentis]
MFPFAVCADVYLLNALNLVTLALLRPITNRFRDLDDGTRVLNGPARFANAGNGGASCAQYCTENGYEYAGTELSDQCFCGSDLLSIPTQSVSGSDCNYERTGALGEACGGVNRMSVYITLPKDASQLPEGLPDGFGYAGCYIGTITLAFLGFNGRSVTAQKCMTYCTSVNRGNAIAATKGESCRRCCFAPACLPDD